ncbi:MAG: methyl-accepting chemotaxis protein, partial [Burkholderiaceae bacterium]
MKLFTDIRIGTRLLAGFAFVLALSICTTLAGLWQLQKVSDATRQMMEKPLMKERMASDWYRNTFAAIRRTMAIAKSSDESLAAFFKEDIKATAKGASEMQDGIKALLSTPEEKALYDRIGDARDVYTKAKNASVKAKVDGNAEESNRILEQEFLPAAKTYENLLLDFLSWQRKSIDGKAQTIEQAYRDGMKLLVALVVLTAGFSILCGILIARSITRPLSNAVALAGKVAAGDLTTRIAATSRDEVGQLFRALHAMTDSLRRIVGEVQSGTRSIATASGEIASGNADLSSRTEQQASSLEETASSMEELTATVKQNADNARQANQLAVSASGVAVKGGDVVAQVVTTMGSIHDSARKIVDIIG